MTTPAATLAAPVPLTGVWVAVSGSVPHPDEPKTRGGWDELAFRLFVSNLAGGVLAAGGGITHGSHPTFRGFVEDAGRPYASAVPKRVRMYLLPALVPGGQPEVEELTTRHQPYAEIREIGTHQSASQQALQDLADRLSDGIQAMVCCGGRAVGKSLNEVNPQVEAEVRRAIDRRIPVFLIGVCGGVSRSLYEQHYESNPSDLRNGLTAAENNTLYADASPWEAVRLVLKGLSTGRTGGASQPG